MMVHWHDLHMILTALCWAVKASKSLFGLGRVDDHVSHKLLKVWVMVSAGLAVPLLAANLWFGTGDRSYFFAIASQLIAAAAFLAASPSNPDDRDVWRDTGPMGDRKFVFFGCLLLLLAIQFLKLILSLLYGAETWVTTIDLSINMAFYLLITFVPFLHLDMKRVGNRYWLRIWAFEAVYATFLAGFQLLSSSRLQMIYDGRWGCLADSGGIFLAYLFAFDFLTALPLLYLILHSGSYVGNVGLIFNAVISTVSVFAGLMPFLYIGGLCVEYCMHYCMEKCGMRLANAREPGNREDFNYFRVM